MLFCPTCNKPFLKEQQYKRHISYCSKSHTARKRQRSCRACGVAKVKCDFVVTGCANCVRKGIECVFDAKKRRELVIGSMHSVDNVPRNEKIFFPETSSSKTLPSPRGIFTSEFPDDIVLQPYSTSGESPMVMGMESFDLLGNTEAFDLDFLQDHRLFNHVSEKEMQMQSRAPPPIHSPLSPISSPLSLASPTEFKRNNRQNTVQQAFLAMMIDMVQAYPQMMTNQSNLPPFLHHQIFTASPILHTCSALSHLFTIRTPASRPFVWGSIWASLRELGRAAAEDNPRSDEVVSATVATIIYLVMRAIDGDGEVEGSDFEMLMIYENIKNNLMENTQHDHWIVAMAGIPGSETEQTWKKWIILESIYRVGCMWFLLKLVFHIKTGGLCFVADFYREIPLPCTKGEWEARSEEQWRTERASASLARKDGLKTFGDLIDAQRQCDQQKKIDLEVWIARIDGLGMLMNLAVHLV